MNKDVDLVKIFQVDVLNSARAGRSLQEIDEKAANKDIFKSCIFS